MGTPETEMHEVGEEGHEIGDESEIRAITFSPAQHGLRLDQALAAVVPGLSRSYLKQLVEAGAARHEGMVVLKASRTVRAGEGWSIELRPTLQSQAFKPESMPLDIVYQDEHLRVINKPAGLVVHPAPGHWSGTLLNGLLALDPHCKFLPRAGIVHRLDKDTSGLMVAARSRAAMDALITMIGVRAMSRDYLALVHRTWSGPARRTLTQPLGRDPRNRLRMAVVDLARYSGRPARTDVMLLQQAAAGCLVRCKLHTGRTHQIRVHLSHAGHPLLADELYGGAAAAGMARQALHAWRLGFEHPVERRPLLFQSAPPDDFVQALAQWRLGYNESKWLEEPAS